MFHAGSKGSVEIGQWTPAIRDAFPQKYLLFAEFANAVFIGGDDCRVVGSDDAVKELAFIALHLRQLDLEQARILAGRADAAIPQVAYHIVQDGERGGIGLQAAQ